MNRKDAKRRNITEKTLNLPHRQIANIGLYVQPMFPTCLVVKNSSHKLLAKTGITQQIFRKPIRIFIRMINFQLYYPATNIN